MTIQNSKYNFDLVNSDLKAVQRVTRQKQEFQSIFIKKKNPNAVALGHLGGLKGGKSRMEKLSPERRREIAINAARARWGKK